jgi:predicted PurR-regulated permease PerM
MESERFGTPGAPLNRSHPFLYGFLATLGVATAYLVIKAVQSASQVLVLILISLFLAVGLNPAVEALRKRGLKRSGAVLTITLIFVLIVGGFTAAVAPPIYKQTTQLVQNAPEYLDRIATNPTIANLDKNYHFIDKAKEKLSTQVQDGKLVVSAFGGVIGVGKTIFSGLFSAITVFILTLYFLAALPKFTKTAYSLVPASRRERVSKISDEILVRIGGYVGGQLVVAGIAGLATFVAALALGLPYALSLAMVVALCDLIPLIGATLGAVVATLVGFVYDTKSGIIILIFYIIYQQLENYVIYPKFMKRSVSVPAIVTIIAALIGGSLLGLLGGLLAIPTAAAILLIIDQVAIPRAAQN